MWYYDPVTLWFVVMIFVSFVFIGLNVYVKHQYRHRKYHGNLYRKGYVNSDDNFLSSVIFGDSGYNSDHSSSSDCGSSDGGCGD